MIELEVTDERGGFATQAFTLEVFANKPPVVNADPDVFHAIGATSYSSLLDITDPEDDDITFTLDPLSVARGMLLNNGTAGGTSLTLAYNEGGSTSKVSYYPFLLLQGRSQSMFF